MVACPTRVELERFLSKECTRHDAEEIERHARDCETCSAWLEEASADEALLEGLQHAFEGEAPGTAPVLPPGGLSRYRIVRRIAAGGMGTVWEAEQRSPKRRVALKLMRSGFATDRARARFESEAAFLGRLEHPGIARIFEADTFEAEGEPRSFFAMELVDGQPLDVWAKTARPSLRERLQLFRRICDAVQHAHQRGVLHRDLKPANILVTADGSPKVVDFGIARATSEEDEAMTQLTLEGQLVGTLATMSPEQVAGDALGLDTRVDVYALGVVLYQLLSGELPLELTGVPVKEALRRIAEDEPRPLRSATPAADADLETITRVALAKDRDRRYPSVEALSADVGRWLRREPIAARPPSRAYLALRFVQRNRALVGGVTLTFLTLIAGLITTGVQTKRARRAERIASDRGEELERKTEALEQRTTELQERSDQLELRTGQLQERSDQLQLRTDELETESARLESVLEFIVGLLGTRNPDASGRAKDFTVREALDEASRKLANGEIDDPEVEATLRFTLGNVYRSLDDLDRAAEHLERSIELLAEHAPGSREHGEALNALGALHYKLREFDVSEGYWLEAIDIFDASDADDAAWRRATVTFNLAVLDTIRGNYDRAEELTREALAIHERELGRENHTVANDLGSLALIYARRLQPEEAERLYRESLAVHHAAPDPENLYTAEAHYDLGSYLSNLGRHEEGIEEVLKSLEIFARILGPDHEKLRRVEAQLAAIEERME